MPAYLPLIAAHFARQLSHGVDCYGPRHTAMWLAVLSTPSGQPPADDTAPKRVYRLIGAPRGSSLYWDQPLLVAAHACSRLTGDPRPGQAATAYVADFLKYCVADNGLLQWGNHQYYDVYTDQVVSFSGGYHELRPLTPAWDLFWQASPTLTERYLRTMVARHLHDPATGGFNRHDDQRRDHAFIEAGGVLVETLGWLAGKTGDQSLRELAWRIADYSYQHRHPATGLIANEPDHGRWDSRVSTTEVGLWAQGLLRAHQHAPDPRLVAMAKAGVMAYLKYGFDSATGQYFGQLALADGQPVEAATAGYWPKRHSDLWTIDQWPTHDYPLALAEACLSLWQMSGEPELRQGVARWAAMIIAQTPARGGAGTYAEHYGRAIHFMHRAGQLLDQPAWVAHAQRLAAEAIAHLRDGELFQTLPGTQRYEAVGGLGYLFQALLILENGAASGLPGTCF